MFFFFFFFNLLFLPFGGRGLKLNPTDSQYSLSLSSASGSYSSGMGSLWRKVSWIASPGTDMCHTENSSEILLHILPNEGFVGDHQTIGPSFGLTQRWKDDSVMYNRNYQVILVFFH